MKLKIYLLTTLAAVIALFAAFTASAQNSNLTISKTGVGPVKLGMETSKLPKTVEGLYSKLERKVEEDMYDETVYFLASLNGKKSLTIYEYDGKVWSIEVYNPACKTAGGRSVNSTAANLLTSGARALEDNNGFEGLVIDGVLFYGYPMTKTGTKKVEDSYLYGNQNYVASDFVANGKASGIRINEYISNY